MSDGVFGEGRFTDGIAPQSVEGDYLDLLVRSPMRIERSMFRELAVPYGVPASVRNRLDHVDVLWPTAPGGAIAYDVFPARDDSTLLPGGIHRGDYFHSQAVRRRAALARLGVAYIWRHDGDEPISAERVSAAYRFVSEHRNDPPDPEANPLEKTTYEQSMTRNMGVSYDPGTGSGSA